MARPDPLDDLLTALARSLNWQAELGNPGVMAVDHPARAPVSTPYPREIRPPATSAPATSEVVVPPSAPRPEPATPPVLSPVAEDPPVARRRTLADIRESLGECTRCKLSSGRKKIVFGTGDPDADLMFIGEGPGAEEDRRGEPFVGRAGQLLTRMIEAMGLDRSQVYITNVVKCRPPQNRDPELEEIVACEPFLHAQIDSVRPKVIVVLGRVAASTLLREHIAITRQRGTWRTYHGVRLMLTLHPAYLLRNPAAKRGAWQDLQAVMAELGLPQPPSRRSAR